MPAQAERVPATPSDEPKAAERRPAIMVVEIADSGPGVPEDVAERIFDPFFTTKDVGQGTGLGLATARRIVVDLHGGSLTHDAEPGRTVFRVRLPFTKPDRRAPWPPAHTSTRS
jgi:signal transduction histidine kinase